MNLQVLLGIFLAGTAVLVVVLLPQKWRLTILLATSAVALSLGTEGQVEGLRLTEVLALPMLVVVGYQMLRSTRAPVRRGTGILWLALVLLLIVEVVNLVRTRGATISADRAHFDLFIGLAMFVDVAWLAGSSRISGDILTKMLRILLYFGVAVGALRLVAFYGHVTLSFLAGTFNYGATRVIGGGVVVERIGGMAEAAVLVLAASAGLWSASGRRTLPLAGAFVGLLFVLFSGGRSLAIGVVVAAAVLLVTLSPRLRWKYAGGMLAVAAAGAWVAYLTGVSRQMARLIDLGGGLAAQDPYRSQLLSILWRQFLAHPLLGKGIGVPVYGIDNSFVSKEVTYGGHAAYSSMLANFGVFGGLAIVVLIIGVVAFGVAGAVRRRRMVQHHDALLGVFVFIVVYGTITAVEYTIGGNGYSDPMPFTLAGLLAGVWLLRTSPRYVVKGALRHSERAVDTLEAS